MAGGDVAQLLYVSLARMAGAREAYAIRIPTSVLAAAGITPPTEPRDPAAALATLQREEDASSVLDAGVRQAASRRVAVAREEQVAYEEGFGGRLLQQISQIPRTLVRPHRLIKPGDSVETKNAAAIGDGVATQMSQASPTRRLATVSMTQAFVSLRYAGKPDVVSAR